MFLSASFVVSVLTLLPLVFSYDKAAIAASLRKRRMLLFQPHQRRNAPFVIRVPYSKIVPTNSLFSHSVAWRAKLPQVKTAEDENQQQPELQKQQQQQSDSQPQQQPSEPEVTQFHSQDTNGQVMFGFNSPDQMRIETRNADGTVHGTYSYLDPYGQVIRRQYWDNGSGFHVTSNTYPVNGAESSGSAAQSEAQYTPDVQAARDLHFQLYQQALESLIPHQQPPKSTPENITLESTMTSDNQTTDSLSSEVAEPSPANGTRPVHHAADRHQEGASNGGINAPTETEDDDDSENAVEPSSQNGSIVIENPEYLRISWTTENKKYRLNLYNSTDHHRSNNSSNKVQIRHQVPDTYNITKFGVHSRNPK